MTRQIRHGVFETNSSSTHSICVAKNPTIAFPKMVRFEFGEFGWEVDTLGSVHAKASYLYTGAVANGRQDVLDTISEVLGKNSVPFEFEEEVKTHHRNPDTSYEWYDSNAGYVDHSNEMGDFLNAMLDEEKLVSYLFSPLSFVLTGNDNDESDVDIKVDYPHDEYFKGN